MDNALAKHHISEHETLVPLPKYRVLKSHLTSDIKRKIAEVLFIRERKPELNARDEIQYIIYQPFFSIIVLSTHVYW